MISPEIKKGDLVRYKGTDPYWSGPGMAIPVPTGAVFKVGQVTLDGCVYPDQAYPEYGILFHSNTRLEHLELADGRWPLPSLVDPWACICERLLSGHVQECPYPNRPKGAQPND